MLAESVYKGVLDNRNFREFLHGAGGIFDFQNGNSRWPWKGEREGKGERDEKAGEGKKGIGR